ncbi:MAG: RAQPRD family integrative conjugative element protein [Pseudomonadota bacterium]
MLLNKYFKVLSIGVAMYGAAIGMPAHADNAPLANTAVELERARLADIVAGIDQLLNQIDMASRSGASGRIQFNYSALRRDLLGRRELIQRYINGAWEAPRDIAPLATTYNR